MQWAFTGLRGRRARRRPASPSSWFRGNGTWNNGRAQGTIYADDSGGGTPKTRITLKVSGGSALSPGITKYGYKGVGVVLPVTVTTTNDKTCATGTTGTISLFASYYGAHNDHMVAHFAGACSDHDLTFVSRRPTCGSRSSATARRSTRLSGSDRCMHRSGDGACAGPGVGTCADPQRTGLL